jgi:dTDP-4-amino-4,6-dideoxygalactose transaminase
MTFSRPYELVAPLLPPVERLVPDIERALASRWLSNGVFVERLEAALTELVGTSSVVAMASGTTALMASLRALRWAGEVITPSFGFGGTAHAIRWVGAEPVFAEVDRETFLVDPNSVARLRSDRTAGVLAVDAYGVPVDVAGLAEATGLPVLVDAAHGLGSRRPHATRAAGLVYSLHPTKTIVAGEGGIVATDDGDVADALRRVRNFGFEDGQDATEVGLNAKMPELSAILAYHQIELLPRTVAGRSAWDAAYRRVLGDVPGIRFQRVPGGAEVNYQYTPVVIDPAAFGRSRDEVATALREENVVTRPYFFPPIHRMRVYAGTVRTDDLTWTDELAATVLCLPVHPGEDPSIAERIGEMVGALRVA